jgi:acyl-CoA synthetase (AMP-forming)/AMP-acid ligase II
MERWDPARAAALVDEYRLTVAGGAPVQLAALLDEQERGTATLASLREFGTGAAGVPPALIVRAESAGIRAHRTYGSSESPIVSMGDASDPLDKRAGTDGRLLPGKEVRIVDAHGQDVETGTAGEILLRSRSQFVGYTDPARTAEAFLPGGWFRTGDIGRLDDDGYLTITGRKKEIIIRGGENISAQEVEAVLSEHPAVAEVAVLGLPDERMGERVCAVVVLRPGGALTLGDVGAHFAATGVARQKTPERLEIVATLPRTPSGKVPKHVLLEQLTA